MNIERPSCSKRSRHGSYKENDEAESISMDPSHGKQKTTYKAWKNDTNVLVSILCITVANFLFF